MEQQDDTGTDEVSEVASASEEPRASSPDADDTSKTSPSDGASAEAGKPANGAASAGEGKQVSGAAAGGGPQEVLAPKERRARARAQKAQKRGPGATRTPEERQADREAARRGKAVARRTRRLQEREKARAAGRSTEPTAPRPHVEGTQKTRQGIVVSDKADKTITVRIDDARRHRRYAKIVRTTNTLHVHDERNEANAGDTVVVREARPLSRTKRWRLVEVVERAQ